MSGRKSHSETGRVAATLLAALLSAAPALAQKPASAPPASAPPASTPQAPSRRFDITEYRVEGNTVLSGPEIETVVYPFLGPGKTLDDIEHARAALEKAYADRGYPTVTAELPEQHASGGLIVLKVTERKVGRLRVTGSRYYALDAIKSGAPSLAEGRVPNINDVQRDIVGLNQWPDRTVTPALRAGRAPDTVDVDLQVNDHLPLHASLELNNRQSIDTKPLRLSGSLGYNNLWQRGDSATFFFQVAPERPSDATVFSGSYLFRIPGSRLSLLASYLHSDSNVTSVGSTNVIGKGDIAGFRLLIPLTSDARFTQTISAGLDYKHFGNGLTLLGASTNTPVTYYPLTVDYQGNWTFTDGSQTALDAAFGLGLRGLGSNAAQFDANRAYAQPNFSYLRATLAHTQTLPYGMQAYARVQGQAAGEPLIANEQLSVGGLDSVRGYLESEALGDYGGFVQTELRSPNYGSRVDDRINDLRVHVFYDAAEAAIHRPLPQQKQSYSLNSVGVGARVRLLDYLNASVEDAITLSNGPNTHGGSNSVLFRLYGDY